MAAIKHPRARLEHILFHIRGVGDTVGGIDFDTFTSVYHMERTVERAIEVISEAARALPPELVAKYPQIEWQKSSRLEIFCVMSIIASTRQRCGISQPFACRNWSRSSLRC